MESMALRVWLLMAGPCLCLSLGCGPAKPKTAEVTGIVTKDGEPMEKLGVFFQPVANSELGKNTVFASGDTTDAEGKFTLRIINYGSPGAVIGEHIVTINEPAPPIEEFQDRDLPYAEMMAEAKKKTTIPKKWTDGSQKRTVAEGTNHFEIELNE